MFILGDRGVFKGVSFVELDYDKALQAIDALDQTFLLQSKINVRISEASKLALGIVAHSRKSKGYRLYVSGLPLFYTHQEIRNLFEEFEPIEIVNGN
jgi:hypothetical protein